RRAPGRALFLHGGLHGLKARFDDRVAKGGDVLDLVPALHAVLPNVHAAVNAAAGQQALDVFGGVRAVLGDEVIEEPDLVRDVFRSRALELGSVADPSPAGLSLLPDLMSPGELAGKNL